MTDTTLYDTVNNLPAFSFIGGTDKILTFNAYEEDGFSPLDLTGATVNWVMCPYGEYSQKTLEISGDLSTTLTSFTVEIPAEDTLALSGKFIQQVIITDVDGNIFRPGQGEIIIIPAIPET